MHDALRNAINEFKYIILKDVGSGISDTENLDKVVEGFSDVQIDFCKWKT